MDKKILTIKLKVNELEAYQAVSSLGFEFEVVSADFDGRKENFTKSNTPSHFLRDNQKNKKQFRDIRGERKLK